MERLISTLSKALVLGLFSGPLLAAGPLVDGDWLEANLGNADVVVLDVRNRIDNGSRQAYEAGHVPGAIYSNYIEDGWRVERDGVVGMLPEPAQLERLIGGLGIGNDDHVVIVAAGVSAPDYASATRVYWTFKVMGHDRVSVLDGGYFLWAKQGRPVETGSRTRAPKRSAARYRPELVATREDVARVVSTGSGPMLVDNRPESQYRGDKQSGSTARAGAIPGARNIPVDRLYDADSHELESLAKLAEVWRDAGIADGSEQITYCNTGHMASLGWFASSELLGNRGTRLYDGSAADWSRHSELPMVNTKP